MLMQEVTITKKEVLSRDSALLVQRAVRYESEVYFEQQNKKINGKSLMGVISLGLKQGSKLVVITKGADESEALKDIAGLISRDFEL